MEDRHLNFHELCDNLHQISTRAYECPNCGVRRRGGTRVLAELRKLRGGPCASSLLGATSKQSHNPPRLSSIGSDFGGPFLVDVPGIFLVVLVLGEEVALTTCKRRS